MNFDENNNNDNAFNKNSDNNGSKKIDKNTSISFKTFQPNRTIAESTSNSFLNFNDFDIIEFLKTIFLISLPHLALIVVFLVYLLIGAAIIQELEFTPNVKNNVNENSVNAYRIQNTHLLNKFNQLMSNYEENFLIKLNLINETDFNYVDDSNENLKSIKFLRKLIKHEKKSLIDNKLIKQLHNRMHAVANDEQNEQEAQFNDEININEIINSINYTDITRKSIKSFLDYKQVLKLNTHKHLIRLIKDENNLFKKQFEVELENMVNDQYYNRLNFNHFKFKNNNWTIKNSVYFSITLLTSIGYGDIVPQTVLGKLFTIIYTFIGIPLTFILLNDIGAIFTHFLKFLYIFILNLYQNGYFDRLTSLINNKKLISYFYPSLVRKLKKKLLNRNEDDSNEASNENNSGDSYNNDQTRNDLSNINNSVGNNSIKRLKLTFGEIVFDSYENSNSRFDFPLIVLCVLIFIYLTFGSFIYASNQARYLNDIRQFNREMGNISANSDFNDNKSNHDDNDISILNCYYFNLMSLMRIGFGDLIIYLNQTSTLFLFTFYTYLFIGVAFFILIIEYFKIKLKFLLIKTGQNIIFEILKFAKQLGYKIDSSNRDESINSKDVSSSLSSSSNQGNTGTLHTLSTQTSILLSQPAVSSVDNYSDKTAANSNDEVFMKKQQQIQSQAQQQQQQNPVVRRKSTLLQKRKSLLKDLNEFKILNNNSYAVGEDLVLKCDKQTQITTLLCSKYKEEIYNTFKIAATTPIIKVSALAMQPSSTSSPASLPLKTSVAVNATNKGLISLATIKETSLINVSQDGMNESPVFSLLETDAAAASTPTQQAPPPPHTSSPTPGPGLQPATVSISAPAVAAISKRPLDLRQEGVFQRQSSFEKVEKSKDNENNNVEVAIISSNVVNQTGNLVTRRARFEASNNQTPTSTTNTLNSNKITFKK